MIASAQELADNDTEIGQRLSEARESQGLTAAQLARRIGIKTTTLSQWERGRSHPRANRLSMLSGVLGVSPTWILTGRGEGPASAIGFDAIKLAQAELSQARRLHAEQGEVLARLERRLAEMAAED